MEITLTEDNRKIKIKLDTEVLFISPCSFIYFDEVIEYQKVLMEELINSKGYLSNLLKKSNQIVHTTIEKINKLLNIELDITKLDVRDILKIYFTTSDSWNEYNCFIGEEENISIKPSYISIIHGLDFLRIAEEVVKKMEKVI